MFYDGDSAFSLIRWKFTIELSYLIVDLKNNMILLVYVCHYNINYIFLYDMSKYHIYLIAS